ncbi:hypothetical protein N0V93_003679 [Gnomoniopsis smithogilvyi]|uniref:Uncharacterized protein n=1 Tax=Gnomoniopsis smithogilvyi TaxID=1191159 RepID=A0A9W8YYY1_9PEZI|nr:hypothetical protein N0V93_003679 [Gnomoniopsis smithogilvyi]
MSSDNDEASTEDISEACCGFDFGTHSSKACLAYLRRRSDGRDEMALLRVSNSAGWGHPERPPDGKLEYAFSSYAVLEDGELRTGRHALHKENFALKTMCAKFAGIPNRVVRELPDGPRLLQAWNEHRITDEMMRSSLLDHFALVREMVQAAAIKAKLRIATLILSIPDYLHEDDTHLEAIAMYKTVGSRGGSQLSNDSIRQAIKDFQEQQEVPTNEMAAMMRQYEEIKLTYDYTLDRAEDDVVVLAGLSGRYSSMLVPAVLQGALMHAFARGLSALKEEVQRVAQLRRDFAVVLCGGSYGNPGLRKEVEAFLEETVRACRANGFHMAYVFLVGGVDPGW